MGHCGVPSLDDDGGDRAPLAHGRGGALVLEKERVWGCWNVYDAGLRGCEAARLRCLLAVVCRCGVPALGDEGRVP